MRALGSSIGFVSLLFLASATAPAYAGGQWSVGVRFGSPGYGYYRPWAPGYYAYRPYYPVYVAPPAVYLPPPVIVAPPPVVQPVYPVQQQPQILPQPAIAPSAMQTTSQPVAADDVKRLTALLADPDEKVRSDTVMQLGRMKATTAVDALAATLAGDRSPTVREAAARALALVGSPRGLTALQRAALADADRDVRHSAQFAIDVIQNGR